MTIEQILKKSNINRRDAEIITAHVLNKRREFLFTHQKLLVSKCVSVQVNKLFKKRQQGIPLAYLTGHKEFYGLDFIVNKHTLIPRPETELIVDLALSRITYHVTRNTTNKNDKIILVDVGTGTGCIPISILKNLKRTSELSPLGRNSSSTHFATPLKTIAIDISKKALETARLNAKKHHVKIKFLSGDLLQPFINTCKLADLQTCKLILTANLPYLTPSQFKSEPSIQHEPRLALVAGPDGLKYYRRLLKQIRSLISNFQFPISLFIEINPSQTSSIKLLIKQHLPQAKITIHQDLAGRNRVVEVIVSTEL